jgi:hypothetical protein
MPAEEAMAALRAISGLGPMYASLVYLRATGVTDALICSEPRLASYLRHYYQLPEIPDAREIGRIAEPWRPFRTWAGVLFRVAGDRAGLAVSSRRNLPGGRIRLPPTALFDAGGRRLASAGGRATKRSNVCALADDGHGACRGGVATWPFAGPQPPRSSDAR